MTLDSLAPAWKPLVQPYCAPHPARSVFQVANTLVPLVVLEVLAVRALEISVALTLAFDLLVAGFLVRVFILQHDCGHGSLFGSQRWNDRVGTVLGFITLTPYYAWRHRHAVHHATTGDLDRRGTGDIHTLTVDEYLALPPRGRLAYRLFRNPFVMFVVGAAFIFFVAQRFTGSLQGRPLDRREARNIRATNVFGAAILVGIWALGGWQALLLVHLPASFVAAMAGVFLFYVQHQFEEAYWRRHAEWDFVSASLSGSTYLKLPRVLRFFTGDIGVHHLHHLAPKIPNYRLQRCLDENPALRDVRTLGLREALATIRLKLYDEARGKMVTWREAEDAARAARGQRAGPRCFRTRGSGSLRASA